MEYDEPLSALISPARLDFPAALGSVETSTAQQRV
jgi:hypothetical protein